MTNEAADDTTQPTVETPAERIPTSQTPAAEDEENFAEVLSDFERAHVHRPEAGARQLEGRVISLSADQVFLDIGYKMEGVLPRSAFDSAEVKTGDVVLVSIKGRNEEGYY